MVKTKDLPEYWYPGERYYTDDGQRIYGGPANPDPEHGVPYGTPMAYSDYLGSWEYDWDKHAWRLIKKTLYLMDFLEKRGLVKRQRSKVSGLMYKVMARLGR